MPAPSDRRRAATTCTPVTGAPHRRRAAWSYCCILVWALHSSVEIRQGRRARMPGPFDTWSGGSRPCWWWNLGFVWMYCYCVVSRRSATPRGPWSSRRPKQQQPTGRTSTSGGGSRSRPGPASAMARRPGPRPPRGLAPKQAKVRGRLALGVKRSLAGKMPGAPSRFEMAG